MIQKKFPIPYQCLILTHDNIKTLSTEFGQDLLKMSNKKTPYGNQPTGIWEYIDEKIAKIDWPNYPLCEDIYQAQIKRFGKNATKNFLFENESIISLPNHHDSKADYGASVEKRLKFLKTMKELMGDKYDEEKLNKNVSFGSETFEWINPFLDFLFKKFKKYYVNGSLKVFNDTAETLDKKCKIIDTPYDKVYFLSDIEKMMQNDYDLKTDNLYQWIMDSLYIEGRYWERVFGFELSLTNFREKKCPQNIEHIINLMKQDLELDKDTSRYDEGAEVISIFIDYKKNVKIS